MSLCRKELMWRAGSGHSDSSGQGMRRRQQISGFPPRRQSGGTGIYAPFSGRGDTRVYRAQKPDLAAPGVGIMAPDRDGGYSPVTGTSFAAPLVTGAAALLMEWGIVRENDPYLYGEKVKAYLRKGARRLPSELAYPNPRLGYGALCVADSLPK